MKKTYLILILTGGVLVILFFFFSKQPQPTIKIEPTQPIKIGVVLSTSGIAATNGESIRKGLELALNEINTSRKRPFTLIIEDDQTNPTAATKALQKLITIDHVDVVIGGTWNFLVEAMLPTLAEQKITFFTPSSHPDTVSGESDYLFFTHSPISIHQKTVEQFLNQLPEKRIVILTVNNSWGQAHHRMFNAAAHLSSAQVLKEIILPKNDSNTIATTLAEIKKLNPDAVLTTLNFNDQRMLLSKRKELKIDTTLLMHSKLKDDIQNNSFSSTLLENVSVYSFSSPRNDFITRFQGVYNELPGEYADTAYDTLYIIDQVIRQTNGKTDPESIRTEIKNIVGYQGVSREMTFSTANFPTNKTSILETFTENQFTSQ